MKRFLIIISLLMPLSAMADLYTLSVSWIDTTPISAQYTAAYNVEYQIAANPVVAVSNQATPAYSTQITAAPNDIVKVRVQNKNTQGPVLSAWSVWVNATAQAAPTTPANPSGITFTLTRIP